MPRYRVTYTRRDFLAVDVEASDENEAIEKADQIDYGDMVLEERDDDVEFYDIVELGD